MILYFIFASLLRIKKRLVWKECASSQLGKQLICDLVLGCIIALKILLVR